jgi:hypothetical protein
VVMVLLISSRVKYFMFKSVKARMKEVKVMKSVRSTPSLVGELHPGEAVAQKGQEQGDGKVEGDMSLRREMSPSGSRNPTATASRTNAAA